MKKAILPVVLVAFSYMSNEVTAFGAISRGGGIISTTQTAQSQSMKLHMNPGGGGWDNENFLDNLSSNDNEEEQKKKYEEFKEAQERMAKMRERQQEFLNSEEGQRFQQQREKLMSEDNHIDDSGAAAAFDEYLGINLPKGVGGGGGGTRLQAMMAQAEQKKRMRDALEQSIGFTDPMDDEDFA
eukprot:CAMPEP_0116025618 /NCGR_PEP_ID=MMETSP0321-20121206/13192_1 /TAXON_ID=163516 /ORGANISM="Leptocylindrus danicus var. danicus, Strain B650" /LENGTH=183 /DNA_ID=CAMNT_0003497919 /DNA_START=105 /DNA_END=656 /DNA_ORIENTATION=+